MPPPSLRRPILWTLFHAVLWGILVALILVGTPRFEQMCMDYGVDLPWAAVMIIQVAHTAAQGMAPLLLALAILLGIDFAATRTLDRTPDGRPLARLWIAAMTAVPIGLMLLTALTLGNVLLALRSKLSG